MKFLMLCVLLWIFADLVCSSSNFTFTYNMAMLCKEHLCQHGYKYETAYYVGDADRKLEKSDKSIVFEMHLAILAASNGHILLSSVPQPDSSDRVYEIVVGGGGNKFTELRGNLKRNARASTKTLGILSPIEFRAFYIKISEDGLIEFGREGDNLPVLSYQDMNPIPVRYFSFAAWTNVEAKFLYDCPIPSANGTSVTPDSAVVEPNLSNADKLKRTLLLDRDPMLSPDPVVTVSLGVKVTSIRYDAFESKLTTGLSIIRKWTDNSMAWNPNKFNGTTYLSLRQGQIWTPSLSVYNSDGPGLLTAKNSELVSMVNSGEATLHMQTTVKTLCYDYSFASGYKWPRDEYLCTILMEPWINHEQITFTLLSPDSDEMKAFAIIDEVVQNEWEVYTTQKVVNATAWNDKYGYSNNYTHKNDRLLINVSLTRRATAYNIVFYTPLLVLMTFVLLSFWSEPLKIQRVWFYSSCTVVICAGLCYVDFLVPCHIVPSILVLYVVVLGGVLIALLIHVALMTSTAKKLCKMILVQNVLTAQWFRTLFCLPPLKVCQIYQTIDEAYENEEDNYGVGTRNSNIEEMESDNKEYNETAEIAEVIDKMLFVIYSVTYAVMLALHF